MFAVYPGGVLAVWFSVIIALAAPSWAQDAPDPVRVLVTEAQLRSIRPGFEHPAVVEALETAAVRPVVGGQIVERDVTPGDVVEEGDLLFRIDDREYRFALAEAEAALKLASAEEEQRRIELDRSRQLVERQAVAQQELDLAQAYFDAAQAKVAMAQAQVDRARKALEDTEIRAPFGGRISAARRAVGDIVQLGDPTQPEPMAEIVRLDPIYAISFISQQVYNEFLRRRDRMEQQGQEIPELELTLILPGGAEYPETGTFVSWDFEAAATRGSIAARAEFPNPHGELLPGENVTIRGRLIEALDRVVVPQRAVAQDQEGRFVMVVGPDNTVERRLLELGLRDGADWTVIEGLDDGERVIVEGLQKVRPGVTVATEPFEG
jgi:RND family efflux transporter MFP subunit